MATQKVGEIAPNVAAALGRPELANAPIYLGDSNVAHMQARHPADFLKYGSDIPTILASPDYVGQNPKDNSIEYVEEYFLNA